MFFSVSLLLLLSVVVVVATTIWALHLLSRLLLLLLLLLFCPSSSSSSSASSAAHILFFFVFCSLHFHINIYSTTTKTSETKEEEQKKGRMSGAGQGTGTNISRGCRISRILHAVIMRDARWTKYNHRLVLDAPKKACPRSLRFWVLPDVGQMKDERTDWFSRLPTGEWRDKSLREMPTEQICSCWICRLPLTLILPLILLSSSSPYHSLPPLRSLSVNLSRCSASCAQIDQLTKICSIVCVQSMGKISAKNGRAQGRGRGCGRGRRPGTKGSRKQSLDGVKIH